MATFKSFGPDILKNVISEVNEFCNGRKFDLLSWEVSERGSLYMLVLCYDEQQPKTEDVVGFRLQQ